MTLVRDWASEAKGDEGKEREEPHAVATGHACLSLTSLPGLKHASNTMSISGGENMDGHTFS